MIHRAQTRTSSAIRLSRASRAFTHGRRSRFLRTAFALRFARLQQRSGFAEAEAPPRSCTIPLGTSLEVLLRFLRQCSCPQIAQSPAERHLTACWDRRYLSGACVFEPNQTHPPGGRNSEPPVYSSRTANVATPPACPPTPAHRQTNRRRAPPFPPAPAPTSAQRRQRAEGAGQRWQSGG